MYKLFNKGWQRAIVPILLIVLIAFGWCLTLNRDWGTDYGVYYVGSKLISPTYRLYVEHFDHKGPALYFFLKTIGEVIGFGAVQAMFSLFIICFMFLFTVYEIGIKFFKSKIKLIFIILVGGSVLFGLDSNASITIFWSTLLLWSFYFLYKNITDGKEFYLYVAFAFWCLVFYTRIDAWVFLPIFLFSVFGGFKWKIFIKKCLIMFAVFCLFGVFFKLYFGYTLKDYWTCNFLFNFSYIDFVPLSNIIGLERKLLRPVTAIPILMTGLPIVFYSVISNIKKFPLSRSNILQIAFLLLGVIASMLSPDRNHYAFLIYTPTIFFIIVNLRDVTFTNHIRTIFLFIMLVFINLGFIFPNSRDFVISYLQGQSFRLTFDSVLAEEVKYCDGRALINRAWVYLFNNQKPAYGLYSEELYYKPLGAYGVFDKNSQFVKWHNQLLASPSGTCFVDQVNLTTQEGASTYMIEILNHSTIVKDFGAYETRVIE
jgi:hypothetical protein